MVEKLRREPDETAVSAMVQREVRAHNSADVDGALEC
jgi:hypothetical protein